MSPGAAILSVVLAMGATPQPIAAPPGAPSPLLTRAEIEAEPAAGTGQRRVLTLAGPDAATVLAVYEQQPDEGDALTIWTPVGDRYRAARRIEGPGDLGLGHIEPPRRFAFRGGVFLHIQVRFSGTGGLHEDEILHLRPDGGLEPVAFRQAPEALSARLAPGEGIWKGAAYEFSDDRLAFEVHVWKDGDANCCPTAGRITGTYTIERRTRSDGALEWTMEIERFERHAPEP
jgi:hypothetical protein